MIPVEGDVMPTALSRKRTAAPKPDQKQRHAHRRYGVGSQPSLPAIPAIDPQDKLFAIRDLAAEADGRRPSPVSIYRWITHTDPRLPAVNLQGRWCTSRAVWLAWLQARSAIRLAKAGVVIDATDDELADVGLDG